MSQILLTGVAGFSGRKGGELTKVLESIYYF